MGTIHMKNTPSKKQQQQQNQFIFGGHVTSASLVNTLMIQLWQSSMLHTWILDRTRLSLLSIQTCQIWDYTGLKYAGAPK